MNHRHLLPDEIDLLLDGEVGFGVAPLKAHLSECTDCAARVEEARIVVDALEDLPHLAPSHVFADRVMSQVPVFVPWHVAARDTVRPWIPRSKAARIALAGLATSAASVVTMGILWVTTETDVLVLASSAAGDRVRQLVFQTGDMVLSSIFGDQVFAAIQRTGTVGIGVALVGLLGATAASVAGLGTLATISSRRRA